MSARENLGDVDLEDVTLLEVSWVSCYFPTDQSVSLKKMQTTVVWEINEGGGGGE